MRLKRLIVLAAPALVCLPGSSGELAAMPPSVTPAEDTLRRPPERRLYVAMWTFHFREPRRPLENNQLLGLSWGKFYGATFINTFDDRTYSAGIQDILARRRFRILSVGFGYRAGLVVGYDERLLPLAGKIPVLPVLQPLVQFDLPRLGFELSYSGIVLSGAINVRL